MTATSASTSEPHRIASRRARWPGIVLALAIASWIGSTALAQVPPELPVVATVEDIGSFHVVTVDQGVAYLGRGVVGDGLAAVDLSDLSAPRLTDRLAVEGIVSGVALAGGELWMTTAPGSGAPVAAEHGLYHVRRESGSVMATRVPLAGDDEAIMMDLQAPGDDRLFISTRAHGTWILDVDGDSAVQVGVIPFNDGAQLDSRGDVVYLTAWGGGRPLAIYDVADATAPRKLGEMAGRFLAVAVIGDYLVVGRDGSGGGAVFDISDAAHPRELPGGFRTAYPLQFLASAPDGAVYATDLVGALYAVDMSSPTRPRIVGTIASLGARSLSLDSDYVYAAQGRSGLAVVARDISGIPTSTPPVPGRDGTRAYLPRVARK